MAPKKEKAAKAPPEPPSDWVARDRSKPHLQCIDSVSINDGPPIATGVVLPPAVFPWVMLGFEGDAVTLKSVERYHPKPA